MATLAAGDQIRLGADAIIEVLQPEAESQKEGNSASLVLRLLWHGHPVALFPGDASKEALRSLTQQGRALKADLVMAPHHGSDQNLVKTLYQLSSPKLVIASCGRYNRWKYPGAKLQSFLEGQNIPLLDTGSFGRIRLSSAKDGAWSIESVRNKAAVPEL